MIQKPMTAVVTFNRNVRKMGPTARGRTGHAVQVRECVADYPGMSLTSALDDRKGLVAAFFAERFPNVRPMQKGFRELMAGRATIRPSATSGAAVPWGTLGTAIDYRMRYYFAAYLPEETIAFLGLGTLSPGAVVALRRGSDSSLHGLARDRWAEPLADFFASLDRAVTSSDPVGRRLPQRVEDALNRHCYVLALLEQFYRVGPTVNSPLLALPDGAGVGEFLELAGPWLEDLRQLSWAFFRECGELLAREHVLNPTFAGSSLIGGADADFIVERCLAEVKTTIDPVLRSLLVYQLLGYVLLDFDDRFRLDEVAVYMSRQSILVRWPLQPFMEALAGGPVNIPSVRQDFEGVVRDAKLAVSLADLLASGRMVHLRR